MSWDVAAQALDHHDTVGALAAAMPDTAYATEADRDRIAADQATNLARVGLALMPLSGSPLADTTADDRLHEQAATSWFGREED